MNSQFSAFWGATRYEFVMQARRPSLWITFAVFTALLLLLINQGTSALNVVIPALLKQESLHQVFASWALYVNTFLPICLGVLLAGRLPRDARTKVDELLLAAPATQRARLFGKCLGATAATLIPMLLVYAGGIVYILSFAHSPANVLLAVPQALLAFAVIALPGVLFVGAFSIACPAVIWSPLYQFLFVGYWYWGTLWFHADIPNLSRTLLSPIGLFSAMGIYGLNESSGGNHPIHITGSPLQGVASIALLLALAVGVIFALDGYLRWRQVSR